MKRMDLNEVSQHETKILKNLDHKNIIKYLDHFVVKTGITSIGMEEKLCIVTEFCEVPIINSFIYSLLIFS